MNETLTDIFSIPVILIPLLPLLGFFVISLFGKQLKKSSGWLGSFTVIASFLCSLYIFLNLPAESSTTITISNWFYFKDIFIPIAFLIDSLTVTMLLVVTGVGALIHIYSIGYMHHDEGFSRFFSYLNLFIFFMLMLVMGSNYLIMFIGWEGVGLCSYLLIGFWFKNDAYNDAAKKAFIMNRIGDLGFLIGMFILLFHFGSLEYQNVFEKASLLGSGNFSLFAATLCLFIGAIGKSAQIPLYTWLPDAMAGPTPVSALIHAATMVTAGVYMIARSNILFALAPLTSTIILCVGIATAFFAAIIGLKQNDIKKVLAYSTVSQLGYMFAAIGVGAYKAAIFHVVTHAFFKALLFLGSGSVIHAMSGEQDIRKMGGLKKSLPITHFTFLIGTLAISGVPFFAGFFSKDEILASIYANQSLLLFTVLAITTVISVVYMFRLYFLTFLGDFRGTEDQKKYLHESPATITVPLIILAILATLGGFLGMPEIFHAKHFLGDYLSSSITNNSANYASHYFEYGLILISIVVITIVIFSTYRFYVSKKNLPESDEIELNIFSKLVSNKFYVDEIYDKIFVRPLMLLSNLFLVLVDKLFIDLIVNLTSLLTVSSARVLRLIQSGNTGFYLFTMVICMVALLLFQIFSII